MKNLIIFFLLVPLISFGQTDTLIGKKIFFTRLGAMEVWQYNSSPLKPIPFVFDEPWTIRSAYKTYAFQRNYLLVNEKKDSSFMLDRSLRDNLANRSAYLEKPFEELKKSFSPDKFSKIISSQLWIGMSEKEAQLSWGKPEKIVSKTGKAASNEWIFKSGSYLFFTNGKLTSIQK